MKRTQSAFHLMKEEEKSQDSERISISDKGYILSLVVAYEKQY